MYESRYQRSRSPRRSYDRSSSSRGYKADIRDPYRSRELRDVSHSDGKRSDSKPSGSGDNQRDRNRSYTNSRNKAQERDAGYSREANDTYSEPQPTSESNVIPVPESAVEESLGLEQEGEVANVETTPFATSTEGEITEAGDSYDYNAEAADPAYTTETYTYEQMQPEPVPKQATEPQTRTPGPGRRMRRDPQQMPSEQAPQDYGGSQEGETNKRLLDISALIKPTEKKFSGRCRLFVANLVNSVTEEELKKLFEQFGETNEVFINKDKGFGFVRLDYRINAELAKNALDNYLFKGRNMKVRFAAHASAIEVHGIGPFASNEFLEQAFSAFGQVEKATVVCDERGKSKGYAIIEFGWKKSAQHALQKINEGCFVLGRLPKPISAKPLQQTENEEGIHEKDIERIPGYDKEREFGPRLITPDSYEYEPAKRWKSLVETERAQKEALERDHATAREKLELELESAVHEHEAEMMRQDLMRKQEELRRFEEMRKQELMNRQQMMQQQNEMHFGFRGQEGMNRGMNEEAQMQESFIMQQKQELQSRRGNQNSEQTFQDPIIRKMQSVAASVGIRGLSPAAAAAAVAMATGGGRGMGNKESGKKNFKSWKSRGQGPDPRMMLGGGSPGGRMPGPPGPMMPGVFSPRIPPPMPVAMQVQRQIMEARRAVAARAGGVLPGMRREPPIREPFNNKRQRRM